MSFNIGQVYNFTVRRVELHRGDPYFILADEEGQETMPDYEHDGWVFRTKVLDFQRDWDDAIGRKMPCRVKKLKEDRWGYVTTFPVLEQDATYILCEKYQEGVNYDFEISGVPGEVTSRGRMLDCYQVRDFFGFHHNLRTDGISYSKGQLVNLRVTGIEDGYLRFDLAQMLDLPKHFTQGQEYDFKILNVVSSKDGKDSYFTLRETTGRPGVHRLHLVSEREESSGDVLTLKVKSFSSKGWLLLEDPNVTLSEAEWKRVDELEDEDTPRPESHFLEYKSSFVFVPGKDGSKGTANIDVQLGKEMMRQIAAFMNADGGELRIGYTDSGTICGINNDLEYLNSSKTDRYAEQYDKSIDQIILLFTNTIRRTFGEFLASLTRVELKQRNKNLVCHIKVAPAEKPVWLNGSLLYVRHQNSVSKYEGNDITEFICKRCRVGGGPAVAPPVMPELPEEVGLEPLTKDADLEQFLPEPVGPQEIWRYFTLYKDGKVSQQEETIESDTVLMNIPVGDKYKNKKKSKDRKPGRLLLCYDNGCVNVLCPKDVVDNKLTSENRKYANGYNKENGVKLLKALVCHVDDYLILRSRKSNGMEMLKAVQISNYRVHDANSMNTRGNLFIKPELAVPYDMEIVPNLDEGFIKDIVCKPSEKYGPGYAVQSSICKDAVEYLNRRRHLKTQMQG